jgi:hypothetical protein
MKLTPSVGLWGRHFSVRGVEFDGSTQYLNRTSAFTGGPATHAHGLISLWYRNDVDNDRAIVSGAPPSGSITFAMQLLRFTTQAPISDSIMFFWNGNNGGSPDEHSAWSPGTNAAAVSASWKHLITTYSWNGVDSTSFQTYLDDSPSQHVHVAGSRSYGFRGDDPNWGIGAEHTGNSKWDGALAELVWYILPSPADISVEATRRKFRSAQGKPVNVGPQGQWPFGVLPIFYLSARAGDQPGLFAANRSGRGDFVFNGTPTFAATSPSE